MTPTLNGFAQGLADSLAERAGVAFDVVLPDGSRLHSGTQAPAFTVVIHTDAALLALATRGHMGLLESYFDQQVDIEGDFGAAFAAGLASGFDGGFNPLNGVENNLHEWRHSNRSPAQAKANARAHYGLGARLLPALARRSAADVHLRLLARGHARRWSRRSATRSTMSAASCGWAPASASSTSAAASAASCSAPPRPPGPTGTGLNTTTEQVDWLREEIAARGLGDRLERARGRFPRGRRDPTTRWSRSACWSMPGATSWPR